MFALGGQYNFICSFDLLEDAMYQLLSFSQIGPKSEIKGPLPDLRAELLLQGAAHRW